MYYIIDCFDIFDPTWWWQKILISNIEFSAFFGGGCYTPYKIDSICTMYKLCLLITVNILFNGKHK